jgi:hypothetical protein
MLCSTQSYTSCCCKTGTSDWQCHTAAPRRVTRRQAASKHLRWSDQGQSRHRISCCTVQFMRQRRPRATSCCLDAAVCSSSAIDLAPLRPSLELTFNPLDAGPQLQSQQHKQTMGRDRVASCLQCVQSLARLAESGVSACFPATLLRCFQCSRVLLSHEHVMLPHLRYYSALHKGQRHRPILP